jgi:hypothetical protein
VVNQNRMLLPRVVQTAFKPIIGLPAWNVKVGHGSFLTLEFGDPRLSVREPIQIDPKESISPRIRKAFQQRLVTVHGDWHLWIYCCNWAITENKRLIGHSESSRKQMDRAAELLDGQQLISVQVKPDRMACRFKFDLGGCLMTSPYEDHKDMEQWFLYEPASRVLTVRDDGRYMHSRNELQPSERRWRPLKFSE